jgi:hypothetical protein
VAIALLFVGCKTVKQTVEVPVYIHDTTQTVREVHDSTFIDRWHTIEVKGDTVYWHDSVVFVKYHVKTDTAYKYVEKPVTVTVTETVEVEKPLGWWQKTFIWIGVIATGIGIGVLMWKTKKWWTKLFV